MAITMPIIAYQDQKQTWQPELQRKHIEAAYPDTIGYDYTIYILDSQTQVVCGGDFIQARHRKRLQHYQTKLTQLQESQFFLTHSRYSMVATGEQKIVVLGQFQGSL